MTTPLGEQLAAWLDGLGLGAHLGSAGLPTYARDAQGRVTWTDPVTGEGLSDEQLEQLDTLLRSQGTDPEHAVPLALLQLEQQARVRTDLLDDPWLTYESLAERRGASVEATRFAVHRAAADRALLVVNEGERTVVPAFQLGEDGQVRTEIEPVLAPLLAAGMDPWRAWAWLARPAALLDGQVPEQAVRDPEEAEIVVRAAIHLAARVVIGGAG